MQLKTYRKLRQVFEDFRLVQDVLVLGLPVCHQQQYTETACYA